MISFESADKDALVDALNKFYDKYQQMSGSTEEAMMNLLAMYEDSAWRVIIFLREKHRPTHYFREGDDKIMLSPASVDLGGVCITPLEHDFNKITKDILVEIFNEVFVSSAKLDVIKNELKSVFNS